MPQWTAHCVNKGHVISKMHVTCYRIKPNNAAWANKKNVTSDQWLFSTHPAVFRYQMDCILLLLCMLDHHENAPLYNFDPLKLHFYIVELGFTGVFIIFLISAPKHRLWYSLEPPRRGGSNEYPQSMFWAEIWEISIFFSENFLFRWYNFQYIWIGVFS